MAFVHVIAPWLWAQAFTTAQRCPNTIVKSAMSPSKARGAKRPREAAPAKEVYTAANADEVKDFFEMGMLLRRWAALTRAVSLAW